MKPPQGSGRSAANPIGQSVVRQRSDATRQPIASRTIRRNSAGVKNRADVHGGFPERRYSAMKHLCDQSKSSWSLAPQSGFTLSNFDRFVASNPLDRCSASGG